VALPFARTILLMLTVSEGWLNLSGVREPMIGESDEIPELQGIASRHLHLCFLSESDEAEGFSGGW
jgi:hypothetical protein